jgi:uncharacterized protein YggE
MATVEITVSETAEELHRPERAVLAALVSFDGPDKSVVREQTVAVAGRLAGSIEQLLDEHRGPVTQYARHGLVTLADRPWHSKGEQLPPVHRATDRFSIEFTDLTALADWVDRFASVEGVAIVEVRWQLTRRLEDEVVARVRTVAVQAARAKAQAYADTLGLGPVRPLAIADLGMLPDGSPNRPIPVREAAGRWEAAQFEGPAIVPEDVRIIAGVDARFSAGD